MNETQATPAELARFLRTVCTCLGLLPLLFAGQCLVTLSVSKANDPVMARFGGKLPALTELVVSLRPAWVVLAILLPLIALVAARFLKPISSVALSIVCAVLLFCLAQLLTYTAWLPFLQLLQVISA